MDGVESGAELLILRCGGGAPQEQGTIHSEREDLDARREHSRSALRQGHRAMTAPSVHDSDSAVLVLSANHGLVHGTLGMPKD